MKLKRNNFADEEASDIIKESDIDVEASDIVNLFEEDFNSDNDAQPQKKTIDIKDIISSTIEDKSKKENKLYIDVDDILNYDDEKRKAQYFKDEFSDKDEIELEEENRKKQSFKDYLIFRKISGKDKSITESYFIKSSALIDKGNEVEIIDESPNPNNESHGTTVFLNKSSAGEIESIEVLCKCGERTLIKLDFSDENKES